MLSVALAMFRQLPPAGPQRRHWYEKSIGVEPVQVPGSAFSVCPSCAVPEMVGGLVLFGAAAAAAPAGPLRPTTAAAAARQTTSAAPRSLGLRGNIKRRPPVRGFRRRFPERQRRNPRGNPAHSMLANALRRTYGA